MNTIACASCNGHHASLEDVRACSTGQTVENVGVSTSEPYTPDPNRIVTGSCRVLRCDKAHTGTLAELSGWACSPEHEASPPALKWAVGEKALWHDKRFEIIEISEGQARLRTGGAGKLVPLADLMQPA